MNIKFFMLYKLRPTSEHVHCRVSLIPTDIVIFMILYVKLVTLFQKLVIKIQLMPITKTSNT